MPSKCVLSCLLFSFWLLFANGYATTGYSWPLLEILQYDICKGTHFSILCFQILYVYKLAGVIQSNHVVMFC